MIFAHGIGERGDLPLPLYLFSWGLGIALVISFVLLGVAWTTPRLAQAAQGSTLASARAVRLPWLFGRALAFACYLACMYAAFFGIDERSQNLLPVTLYVTVWVGMLLAAGLIGDLWGAINPIDTLARLADLARGGLGLAARPGPALGHWPAAVGLMVFLFYELSHPTGANPRTLAWPLLIHASITLIAGFLFGAAWVRDNEPFTVLFDKIGAMGPLFRPIQGGLGARVPLSGLAVARYGAGTAALILVVIGGTSFDGFSESQLGRDVFGGSFGWDLAWVELPGLVASVALVAALYGAGVWWMTRVAPISFGQAWRTFAPSLVPIAFGYGVAHYFQLFSDGIQAWVFRLSDPFGRGWDLLGGADGSVWRIDPDIVAWVQVAAILIGHIGAVAVSHDKAIETFPVGKSLQSQFAMLFVMVTYSTLGLWLLLSA